MEKKYIGTNAGKIWNLLNNKQTWNTLQLCKETGLSERDVHCAIGWLARENKVEIRRTEDGEEDYYLIIEYYF